MEALLRFIFVAVIIYYGFKLFFRYAMPWLISRFVKKQQDKFNQMNGFPKSDYSRKEEGEVNIKSKKENKTNEDTDFGEYVDFEDVDNE